MDWTNNTSFWIAVLIFSVIMIVVTIFFEKIKEITSKIISKIMSKTKKDTNKTKKITSKTKKDMNKTKKITSKAKKTISETINRKMILGGSGVAILFVLLIMFFLIGGPRGISSIIWDTDGTVNRPKLVEGLTPVRHNGTEWVVVNDPNRENWYDYREQRWANARDENGNMFVWIPRYAYRIIEQRGERADKIEVKFLRELTNIPIRGGRSITNTEPAPEVWLVHPAFTFGERELPGIWVGKYATGDRNGVPVIQDAESIMVNITISDAFDMAQKFAEDNGIEGTSMMTRNRDWGAVAYLAHSSYGLNGVEIGANRNRSRIAGYGGLEASTTGNHYGLFDISGGVWQYVAGFVYGEGNNHQHLINNARSLLQADPKYVDRYIVTNPRNQEISFNESLHVFGNAVGELTRSHHGSYSWFRNNTHFPAAAQPIFIRGGYYRSFFPGLFCYSRGTGNRHRRIGFRVVIIP